VGVNPQDGEKPQPAARVVPGSDPGEPEPEGRAEVAAVDALESSLATAEQAEDLPPLDEVTALRAERDALQDQLLRLAAEFDNYRKRSAREWQEQRKRAAADVLRELLEIADNLERALRSAGTDADGLRRGVQLIHQQLMALFQRAGVEPFVPVGELLDPTQHEAVRVVDADDVESQHVVDVVQPGYKLYGQVLRPARVTVSR
jgi:molecular chaperone GrpE